jgi:hypothetical protein
MIPKTWFQQDFILIGFSRGAFILTVISFIGYTVLWYKLGKWKVNGALKTFYWRYFYWLEYRR